MYSRYKMSGALEIIPMAHGQHIKRSIDAADLLFDTKNPRLVGEHLSDQATDIQIIKNLAEGADLAELVISIEENTFVDFEPIVVIAAPDNKFRVLEGNRRLAAIRLLQNESIAQQIVQILKHPIKRPVRQPVLDSIEKIPAIIVTEEADAQSYIGFKHINGPHKWTSFAKAKFVTSWFKKGTAIDEIARKVGDKNQTVKDLIAGMLVLDQAEEEEIFDVKDRTKRGVFGFSHLYTALNRKEYRDYIGLKKDWTENLVENPVSTGKIQKLKNVLQYMYGSKKDNIESVIRSQNPDLKHLGVVFSNPIATQVLQDTNSLEIALEETEEKSAVFERTLITASTQLQKASANVSNYNGAVTIMDMARNMERMISLIINNMESVSK